MSEALPNLNSDSDEHVTTEFQPIEDTNKNQLASDHQDSIDAPGDEFTYEHGNGVIKTVRSAEEAKALCTGISELSLKHVEILLKYSSPTKESTKNNKLAIEAEKAVKEKGRKKPDRKPVERTELTNLPTAQTQHATKSIITGTKVDERVHLSLVKELNADNPVVNNPPSTPGIDDLEPEPTTNYSDSEDTTTTPSEYSDAAPTKATPTQATYSSQQQTPVVPKPIKSLITKLEYDENSVTNDTNRSAAATDFVAQINSALDDSSTKNISRRLSGPLEALEVNITPRLAPSIPEVTSTPTTPNPTISKDSKTNDYELIPLTDETLYSIESSLATADEFTTTAVQPDSMEVATHQNSSAELIFTYLQLLDITKNEEEKDDFEVTQHYTSFRDSLDQFMLDSANEKANESAVLFTDIIQPADQQTHTDTLLKTALYLDQTAPEDLRSQQPELFALIEDLAQLFDENKKTDQHTLITLNMVEKIIDLFVLLGIKDPHGALIQLTNAQGIDFLLDCIKFFSTRVVEKYGQELTPAAAINPSAVVTLSTNLVEQLGRLITFHFDASRPRHLAWKV